MEIPEAPYFRQRLSQAILPCDRGKTLLAQTRARLARAIHPEGTPFVSVKAHERFYRSQLADVAPQQMIVQLDSSTGEQGHDAAVICSLLRLTALAGDPVVAFFPADHYYQNEAAFSACLDRAVTVAQHHSDTVIVSGAEADPAEVEYGWIEPGTHFDYHFTKGLLRVSRFWEKPSYPTAQALVARGCVWNTFVMMGRTSLFQAPLCNTQVPRHAIPGSASSGRYRLERSWNAGAGASGTGALRRQTLVAGVC
jgi:mannose-1-phosphate guanylyltransferase